MNPIFFAYTRSFWAGMVSVMAAIAAFYGQLRPEEFEAILILFLPIEKAQAIITLAPLVSALATTLAVQQRAGAARPYTMDPRALQ